MDEAIDEAPGDGPTDEGDAKRAKLLHRASREVHPSLSEPADPFTGSSASGSGGAPPVPVMDDADTQAYADDNTGAEMSDAP